jgi:hypothetical protein
VSTETATGLGVAILVVGVAFVAWLEIDNARRDPATIAGTEWPLVKRVDQQEAADRWDDSDAAKASRHLHMTAGACTLKMEAVCPNGWGPAVSADLAQDAGADASGWWTAAEATPWSGRFGLSTIAGSWPAQDEGAR